MSEVNSAVDSTVDWALQRHLALVSDQQTGSTNDDAKKNAFNERSDLTLYITAHQTLGRGRGSNTWLDTGGGDALLSTWSLSAPNSPQAITGPRIGLALFVAASKTWPSLPWSIKAPNDLFLDGLKVAGLLVETVSNGSRNRVVIGLGFNVLNHPRKFDTATHLLEKLGDRPTESDWFRFLDELKTQFQKGVQESASSTLSAASCEQLKTALNANSARAFVVQKVTPEGDLIHDKGMVRWTDL